LSRKLLLLTNATEPQDCLLGVLHRMVWHIGAAATEQPASSVFRVKEGGIKYIPLKCRCSCDIGQDWGEVVHHHDIRGSGCIDSCLLELGASWTAERSASPTSHFTPLPVR
jgi:hypothetical protein